MPTDVVHTRLPPPPWNISQRDPLAPPMEPLGGQFTIKTGLKGSCLTAVGGGGRTTDVIHTGAFSPGAWEEFRFWVDATLQHYAFQTATRNFITAVDAGGLITDTIHSDATVISTWEMFKLLPQSAFPNFAIQTLRGFFLTAVGGGGHNSGDTIHTDALTASEWEQFDIFRRLDFGTKSTYGIGAGYNPKNPGLVGGGLPPRVGAVSQVATPSSSVEDLRSGFLGHCSNKTTALTPFRRPVEGFSQQMTAGFLEQVSVPIQNWTRSGTSRNSQ